MVCNISTDAVFSGDYVKRDGADVKRGELPRPKPGEPFAFTLDRFARITRTIDDGDAVLATSPQAVLDAKRQGKPALLAAVEGGDGLEAQVDHDDRGLAGSVSLFTGGPNAIRARSGA